MKNKIEHLVMVVLMATSFSYAAGEKAERTLTVQGQGKVSAVPDIARISVEVSQDAQDLDPVLSQVRKKMAHVIDAVKGQEISEKDIQTELFQVQPKWEQDKSGNRHRVGFIVTNRVSVKIRDIKKTGKVLTSALAAGANSVNGPVFELDNPSVAEREALALATKEALAKARAVAEAAGVQLGEILSINPQSVNWPVPRAYLGYGMMKAQAVAEEPIASGEQTLTAYTTITFAIK